MAEEPKIIDETNYSYSVPLPNGPAAVGRGGDSLFLNIRASKTQLKELLDETTLLQDWIQKQTCNNVALSFLDNENLKEVYFEMKDGFNEYGPMVLMGFKTPQGVEIPRLKLLNKEGEVVSVLTGPAALAEISKRAHEFWNSNSAHEVVESAEQIVSEEIVDYSGNAADYTESIADYVEPT